VPAQPHAVQQIYDADSLHANTQFTFAAWGKQGRDYIRLLDEFDNLRVPQQLPDAGSEVSDIFFRARSRSDTCLLHQLQERYLQPDAAPGNVAMSQRKLDLSKSA